MTHWLHIDWVLIVVAAWLLVFALRRFRFVSRILFPTGGAVGVLLFGVATSAVFSGTEVAVLPIGLPTLPFHLRLDSLSEFFLMVIGATAAGVSASTPKISTVSVAITSMPVPGGTSATVPPFAKLLWLLLAM